jgi:dTDP-4-dehydrorhamnose reductase
MYLIIGGDSNIGMALAKYWTTVGIPYYASTRRKTLKNIDRPFIDLFSKDWSSLAGARFDAVVFCAAQTKIIECELNPQNTAKVNVESTVELAKKFSRDGSYILVLSTSKVFDGTKPRRHPSDSVCPTTEYGRQKAEAEKQILSLPNSAILRLSKVIHSNLFLLTEWQKNINLGQEIFPFKNMYLAPIFMDEVTERIDALIKSRIKGIAHLSGKEDVSYYQFALSYFDNNIQAKGLIRPGKASLSTFPKTFFERFSSLEGV